MFYDIFLDEVLFLRGEKDEVSSFKPDLFAGLDRYSKSEVNNYMNGKVVVLKSEKTLEKFIRISRNVFSNNGKLYYGKISKEVSNRIRGVFPYVLEGFNLSLQTHNLKHIQKKHSNPIKEVTRAQINVTDYDYSLIPYIIRDFDTLKMVGSCEYNNKTLKFKKEINNIIYNLVVYVSFKNHNLEVKTFFKQQKKNSAKVL